MKYFMWLKWHILTSKWWPLFGIVYKLIVPCEHSGTVIKAVFDVIVCFSSAWGFRPSVYHTIWELVKHHSTAASLSWQVQGLWLQLPIVHVNSLFQYIYLTVLCNLVQWHFNLHIATYWLYGKQCLLSRVGGFWTVPVFYRGIYR